MRAVYDADHLIDAHLVKGRLESEGIPAWVRGEFLAGGMGQLPVSGLLAVCVADIDEAEAIAHLQRWRREAAADDAVGTLAEDSGGWPLEPDPAT